MDDVVYLFDASGSWVAFRQDKSVFSPSGDWLGWISSEREGRVFDIEGRYLGTIMHDRIFREIYPRYRFAEDHPGYPGRPAVPNHPGYPGRFELPVNMEEVDVAQHV